MRYVEPYAGGAAVALKLLFEGNVPEVTINDFDKSIYAFWHSAVYRTDELCSMIRKTKVNISKWKELRILQKHKKEVNMLDLGFSTFFLNRTNISGIIQAGVIGGLNQNGKYRIDARFNKKKLIDRIQEIGKFRDKIKIKNLDALDLLKNLDKKSFVYLDPPYVNKANGLYINFYKEEDHKKLAEFTRNNLSQKNHWLTSYDKNDFILRIYSFCPKKFDWNKHYGTSNAKSRGEVILVDGRLKTRLSERFLCPASPT